MNPRPGSPTHWDRQGYIVNTRQLAVLFCTDEERFEAALEAGHLSTKRLFAFVKSVRSRRATGFVDSYRKKVMRHLASCKYCLRDLAAIVDLLAESRGDDKDPPATQLALNFENPKAPLELLAVACLNPTSGPSAARDPSEHSLLSMTYVRDANLSLRFHGQATSCRLEVHHARFPTGTMLRLQHECPGRFRTVDSNYLVLRREQLEQGVRGDLALAEEFLRERSPREITVEILRSPAVLQESDAQPLKQSFERAVWASESTLSRKITALAAWHTWAERSLAERSLDRAIRSLAEEICRQYAYVASIRDNRVPVAPDASPWLDQDHSHPDRAIGVSD
jgi:hypothetical protein